MHLHIPDGVLPVMAWGPGLLVALLLLFVCARASRGRIPESSAIAVTNSRPVSSS